MVLIWPVTDGGRKNCIGVSMNGTNSLETEQLVGLCAGKIDWKTFTCMFRKRCAGASPMFKDAVYGFSASAQERWVPQLSREATKLVCLIGETAFTFASRP